MRRRVVLGSAAAVGFFREDQGLLGAASQSSSPEATDRGGAARRVPPVLRGTVNGATWPGVVKGRLPGAVARRSNLSRLQSALDHARASGKFFELEEGRYEIEGETGLVLPFRDAGGFTWKGNRNALLVQYSTNAPILTVGSIGVADGEGAAVEIDGCSLRYGAAVSSSSTRATALLIGRVWRSTFRHIYVEVEGYGDRRPYRCCHIHTADRAFYFSNVMENCLFRAAQFSNLDVDCNGTGNVWRNIYISNGSGAESGSVLGAPLRVDANAGSLTGGVWDQINVEWTKALRMVALNNCQAMVFNSLHLEGCVLAGYDPSFLHVINGNLTINGLNIGACRVTAADGVSGRPALLNLWGPVAIALRGFQYMAPTSDVPVWMVREQNASDDVQSLVTIENGATDAVDRVRFDDFIDPSTSATPWAFRRYEYEREASRVERPVISLPASTSAYTHYGQFERAVILVPPDAPRQVAITLSDRLRPPGALGSAVRRRAGDQCVVTLHDAGSRASGASVAVVNAANGSLLTRMTAGTASTERFAFDGANWVRMTAQ
jgi:hypothetical protein